MKLTLPQQDVYFEQLIYPGEPVYNVGAKISINGHIIYEILNKAYIALINQHDAYRSIVVHDSGEAFMQVLPAHHSSLGFVDFSNETFPYAAADKYMEEEFTRIFDFDSGELLCRFVLIRISDTFHYLFSVYHHIITDGWSTSLMYQRLVKNYNQLLDNGSIDEQYPYTYADYVNDDQLYSSSATFEEDKTYWKNRFRELPENIFEKIDKNLNVNKNCRHQLVVDRRLYNQLEALAGSLHCSTFHVILGLLYLYFGRKHNNTDFAIGIPVLNRNSALFKKTVGLFMGISALRVQFSLDDTFEGLVKNIRQQLRQDYRHQRFPVGKLISEVGAFGKREQVYNITLSYQKQNFGDDFTGTSTSVMPLTNGAERVALAVYIREFDAVSDVCIDFDYHVNYFSERTASAMVAHFEQLMLQVCAHPNTKLGLYDYLTRQEEMLLLHTFNNTRSEYSKEITFLSLIKDQVRLRKNSTAIFDGSIAYTYGELEAVSNQIAHHITAHAGMAGKGCIAVLMRRSAPLVATLLGVLKSGNAYIPLDPAFPEERLNYIIAHSKANCIIGNNEFSQRFGAIPFTCVEDIIKNTAAGDTGELPSIQASGTAYIIYTSGSTGNPKGVAVGHQSLLNFLLGMQQEPGFAPDDLLFSVTTQSFDISILEFFLPLISGGRSYIATREMLADPVMVIEQLNAIHPTIIQATPSFYQLLYDAGWAGDKKMKLLCGGDLLTVTLAAKMLETCAEVWNMYGPTETTVWSAVKKLQDPQQASNIGKPIRNTQFYILDQCMKLLPVEAAGAIYIGGDGLAKGYHNDEKLTATRFPVNPFNNNEHIYNTGDLGRWNDKGELEFLGRNDYQVKIRGYRVELGEIETKLAGLPGVKSAVVVAKKGQRQEAFLVAYIVPEQEAIDVHRVVASLSEVLPEYMIPYTIIPVQDYPLTPNHKIDRKLLSSLEITQLYGTEGFAEPVTFLEVELSRFFREALEWEEQISVTDNFFSMGGHSINAMRIVNQVFNQLKIRISLKDIFDHPTVRSLSKHLGGQKFEQAKAIEQVAEQSQYPLTLAQYTIWVAVQEGDYRSGAYNLCVAYEITGQIDLPRLEQAFFALIGKYEILRTNFTEIKGVPWQKVIPLEDVNFQIDKIPVAETQIKEVLGEYLGRTFNFGKGLLLRVGIFDTGESRILAFSTHHIIMDGLSVEVMIKEVVHNYQNPGLETAALKFQFKDYVAWLHNTSEERKMIVEDFWKQYLRKYEWAIPVINVPSQQVDKTAAAEYIFCWQGEFLRSVKAAAQKERVTLHTYLITAFAILLYKVYDRNDLCIGTVNSGRTIEELHNQLGMFAKTLPLRTGISPQQTFPELLKKVEEDLLKIDAHQDLPGQIFNVIRLDILFVFQPRRFNYDQIHLGPGLILTSRPAVPNFSRLPLLVNFIELEGILRGEWTYDEIRFPKKSIEVLVLKYEKLLSVIMKTADISIAAINTSLELEAPQTIDIEFNF